METASRNTGYAIFICMTLLYGVALSGYLIANCDIVCLMSDLGGDDGFYYFQIARNLADGRFSTFDGGVTTTNGYHPLWLLLITPLFWVFDPEPALFAIKTFEIALVSGAVALVALTARLARLPWLSVLPVPFALYCQRSFFIGQEPAAALFVLALLFLALALWARKPAASLWPLAVVLFLLPWARTEYMAISLAVSVALLLVERSRKFPSAAEGKTAEKGATHLLLVSAVAGIVAYFLYNQLVFGAPVPVSGAVKRAWGEALWESSGGYDAIESFLAVSGERYFDNLAALAIVISIIPVWRSVRCSGNYGDWLFLCFFIGMFGLAAETLAKFLQTVLFMHPRTGIYTTYYVPGDMMMPMTVAVLWWAAKKFGLRLPRGRWRRPARAIAAAAVAAVTVFVLSRPFDRIDRSAEAPRWHWETATYGGALIMNRLLPEDSIVGSWDSGVLGYFSRFPVVNLDGLVNSWDYLREGGPLSGRMAVGPAQRSFGLTHLANAASGQSAADPLFVGAPDGPEEFTVASVAPRAVAAGSAPPDSAARFWKAMAPHFDYLSDDVGAVADGRLVQAFFRDCDPGDFRERSLALSWRDRNGDEHRRLWRVGEGIRRNGMGLCAAATMLPVNDGSPVRVADP